MPKTVRRNSKTEHWLTNNPIRLYRLNRLVLTQIELSWKLGVSVASIYNWERGYKKPLIRNVRELAKIFKIRVSDLEQEIASWFAEKPKGWERP